MSKYEIIVRYTIGNVNKRIGIQGASYLTVPTLQFPYLNDIMIQIKERNMQYILLFLEGVITFISPCLLPVLPFYISYFAAGESSRKRTLRNALGFITGFTVLFVAMGAFAGTLGSLFQNHGAVVNLITGGIVLLLGLNFLGVLKIGWLNRTAGKRANTKQLGFFSSLLFGIVFSISWTPCVGAFLGSALMMASQSGGTIQGIFMLLVFSVGLGIPFLISAVLIDQLKGTFDLIKKHYRLITGISGGLLVLMGLLMMTGLLGRLFSLLTI